MTDTVTEAELFSALVGMEEAPPASHTEMISRLGDLDTVVKLFKQVEEENPESQLIDATLMVFRGSAGSIFTEEACRDFWSKMMAHSGEEFSLQRAKLEIAHMVVQEVGVDVNVAMKIVVFGEESLSIDECMSVIKAIATWTDL